MRTAGVVVWGLLVCAGFTSAADLRFEPARVTKWKAGRAAAADATNGNTVFVWGDGIERWDLHHARNERIAKGNFREGGCLLDVNGDGNVDLVVNEADTGALVWFEAPRWARHVIDEAVDTRDVLPITLFGKRGLLVLQKQRELRFYEIPPDSVPRWKKAELATLPESSGGLLAADVNQDGLTDLLAGNYWLPSPSALGLAWKIFPFEGASAQNPPALLRLAFVDLWGMGSSNRVTLEREGHPARFTWFEAPSSAGRPWTAHLIAEAAGLDQPNTLAVADLDKDGRPDLLVGERAGKGRLLVFFNEGDHHFRPVVMGETKGIVAAFVIGDEIVTVQEDGLYRWQPVKPKTL